MLASAGLADVDMAAAADMFELGVKLQVLKRGTMFSRRANRLYEVYESCDGLDAIPEATRQKIEREIFRLYVDERHGCKRISHRLNDRGWRTRLGYRWTQQAVLKLVRSPLAAGYTYFDEAAYEAGVP